MVLRGFGVLLDHPNQLNQLGQSERPANHHRWNHCRIRWTVDLKFSFFNLLSWLDSEAPADPVAPVIVISPRNTTVVAGVSEATLECVANARWVRLYGHTLFPAACSSFDTHLPLTGSQRSIFTLSPFNLHFKAIIIIVAKVTLTVHWTCFPETWGINRIHVRFKSCKNFIKFLKVCST